MPVDKQNDASQAKPAKPARPLLSSTPRNPKTPLTGKLVGSAQSTPPNSPRRPPHAESPILAAARTKDGGSSRPNVSGSATSHSGLRRANTTMESPTLAAGRNKVTTSKLRPTSLVETRRLGIDNQRKLAEDGGLGLESRSMQTTKPAPKSAPMLVDRNGDHSGTSSLNQKLPTEKETSSPTDSSTKFFHADDAKQPIQSNINGGRPQLGPKEASFVYVNDTAKGSTSVSASRAASPALPKQDGAGKFFHVDDVLARQSPASKSTPPANPKPPPAPVARLHSPMITKLQHPPKRPQSPKNQRSLTSSPATLASPMVKRGTNHISPPHQDGQSPPKPKSIEPQRRPSMGGIASEVHHLIHRKSMSLDSQKPMPELRQVNYTTSLPIHQPETQERPLAGPFSPQKPVLGTTSLPPARSLRSNSLGPSNTMNTSTTVESGKPALTLTLLSPTKSIDSTQPPPSQLQKVNELAANARRERKVLDLEISNSSLLAINRTLEREMRKQSNELRRFRRLSRSGGFSLAPNSMRAVSGQSGLSTLAETDDGRSDLSDSNDFSDDDNQLDDDDFDSSFDDDSSSLLSPSTRAEHDAAHRAKDEKRLMLDLSKHQQLLVDSQRMSSSIRKCLGLTEELISEAKKALAYQVKVSDVELGGRVLNRVDDVEDEDVHFSGRVLSGVDDGEDEEDLELGGHLLRRTSDFEGEEGAQLGAAVLNRVDNFENEDDVQLNAHILSRAGNGPNEDDLDSEGQILSQLDDVQDDASID